eukprot:785945-Lingulodinium_polyedra.AAC.1
MWRGVVRRGVAKRVASRLGVARAACVARRALCGTRQWRVTRAARHVAWRAWRVAGRAVCGA